MSFGDPDYRRAFSAQLDRHLAAWARRTADDVIAQRPEARDMVETMHAEYVRTLSSGLFVLADLDGPTGEVIAGVSQT